MLESLKQEKKVEYIELIYDLIFVYLIGRSTFLGLAERTVRNRIERLSDEFVLDKGIVREVQIDN